MNSSCLPSRPLKVFLNPSRLAAICLVSSFLAWGDAGAALIEFTTGEGYANGTLNGQPSETPVWSVSSDTNTPFSVNTAAGGSVAFNTTLNNRIVGYNSAIDFTTGAAFTTSMDFTFVQSAATVGTTTLAGLVYAENVNANSIGSTSAGFGRSTLLDGYRLAFANAAVNIAGTALGIDSGSGDTISDVIRLTYTLQQGATSSTWIGTEVIYNVTTDTVVATRSSSAISIGTTDPSSFFGAMQLGTGMASSGLSSFTVLAYSSPVPEPGVVTLLGLGCAVMALRRRRA